MRTVSAPTLPSAQSITLLPLLRRGELGQQAAAQFSASTIHKPLANFWHRSSQNLSQNLSRNYQQSQSSRSAKLPNLRSKRSKSMFNLPMRPGFTLASHSDSGLLGDNKTTAASVDLFGLTSPNVKVSLQGTSLVTTANAVGQFLFTNIPLSPGTTSLTVAAQNRFGTRRFTASLERVTADSVDAVLNWNATILRTIRAEGVGGLTAARTLAIAHVAIDDAVNALVGNTRLYRPVAEPIPASASVAATVAGAAYQVLSQLYPRQKPRLDAELLAWLTALSESESAEASGVAFGQTVADGILAARHDDGSDRSLAYRAKIKPGLWRPTPPRFLPAAGVAWRQVAPFVLQQAAQFRPEAPPRLASRTYADQLNQVKRLGQIDSTSRTAKQTQIARFWLGNPGTSTFPGLWNEIAAQTAEQTRTTLLNNARLFAQLNLALVDASIAAWDTKYTYRSWRPVTAIRLAGSDGNAATRAVPDWQSFLETPAHPDYVSAHSTFAGAAATVLTRTFGSYRFTATSFDLPGIRRSFQSFGEAATEAGMSRIYGGIHTMSANRAGVRLGRQVANYVLQVRE